MTSTTLHWDRGADAAGAVPGARQAAGANAPARERGSTAAARSLGRALLAAAVAAVMVGASSLLAGEGQSGGALTWLALWIVGFAALLIFAKAAFCAASFLQARWTALRANAAWQHEQREMMRVAQYDPRLWRELQIMQDRAAWHRD